MKAYLVLGMLAVLGVQLVASEPSPKDQHRLRRDQKKFHSKKNHYYQQGLSPRQATYKAKKQLRKSQEHDNSDEEAN